MGNSGPLELSPLQNVLANSIFWYRMGNLLKSSEQRVHYSFSLELHDPVGGRLKRQRAVNSNSM